MTVNAIITINVYNIHLEAMGIKLEYYITINVYNITINVYNIMVLICQRVNIRPKSYGSHMPPSNHFLVFEFHIEQFEKTCALFDYEMTSIIYSLYMSFLSICKS